MNANSTDTHVPSVRTRRGSRRLLGGAVAVAGVALIASTAPGVAGGLVTSSDLANRAVTTPKIAKKAVKAKNLADGAVKTAKIKNGAVTTDKLAAGSVGRSQLASDLQPLWAFVWGGPAINKGRGAVAVEAVSPGNYKLTFDRDVSACGYTATLGMPKSNDPDQIGVVNVSAFVSDPKAVNVRTRDLDGSPAAHGFTVQVWC